MVVSLVPPRMTPEQFCYWLQGYFELAQRPESDGLSPAQAKTIREHLGLVFGHAAVPQQFTTTAPDSHGNGFLPNSSAVYIC